MPRPALELAGILRQYGAAYQEAHALPRDQLRILRAIEARTDEWTPAEWQMLERINWDVDQFAFPGIEAFNVPATSPGQVNQSLHPGMP